MFSNFLASYKQKTRISTLVNQGGFGLVELMVSISIVVIVASIILTKQSTFNSAVLLRGQAYEVALRAREIQLSAVSASNDSGDFRSVLGLHFDSTSGSNGEYKVFRDANDDGFYQPTEEFDIQGILDPRFEVREIRKVGGGGGTENSLSIIFVRPNFDAIFVDTPGNNLVINDGVYSVEIDIARRGIVGTGSGVVRTVEITSTGQIGVI